MLVITNNQIEQSKAYITFWNAKIVSGAYKFDKLYHGLGDENEFTDDEKLKRAMDILEKHVNNLYMLYEHLNSLSEDTEDAHV